MKAVGVENCEICAIVVFVNKCLIFHSQPILLKLEGTR